MLATVRSRPVRPIRPVRAARPVASRPQFVARRAAVTNLMPTRWQNMRFYATEKDESKDVQVQSQPSLHRRALDPFFEEWRELRRGMDRLFENAFGRSLFDPFSAWESAFPKTNFFTTSEFVPQVDISESDKAIHVHAELPGIPKENIKVTLRDGVLEISGNKDITTETKDEKRKYRRVERSYGSFVRRIAVPSNVDASQVKAKYENGVLKLEIPKPEDKQAEQFQVKIE